MKNQSTACINCIMDFAKDDCTCSAPAWTIQNVKSGTTSIAIYSKYKRASSGFPLGHTFILEEALTHPAELAGIASGEKSFTIITDQGIAPILVGI